MGKYSSAKLAFRRVRVLQREHGCWPGVIQHSDGTCDLTYDPPVWAYQWDATL